MYRVELAVHDGHDSITFVVSDSAITKLTNKSATTVLEEVSREKRQLTTIMFNKVHNIIITD